MQAICLLYSFAFRIDGLPFLGGERSCRYLAYPILFLPGHLSFCGDFALFFLFDSILEESSLSLEMLIVCVCSEKGVAKCVDLYMFLIAGLA